MPNPPLPDYRSVDSDEIRRLTTAAIEAADAHVAAAIAAGAAPTFASVLQPLEDAATIIADAYGRGAFMARVHPDEDIRSAAIDEEERLTKWGADLVFRRDLFDAVTRYASSDDATTLTGPHRRLLDHWLRDLRRAGHDLSEPERKELQLLRRRLIEVEVAFGRNLDAWDDAIEVTRDELDGLPDAYVDGLRPGPAPGTYRVSMEYPDYTPFMQQARRRDLRRRLLYKFWNRAADVNRPLLEEAVALRRSIADVLGLDSWAHHAMETKMAGDPAVVDDLYESIIPALEAKAASELRAMHAVAADDGLSAIETWDWAYYHDVQKRRDFGVDANEVAEYFPLEPTIEGMFAITAEVFGLEYREIEPTQAWHPDVALYAIHNRGDDEPLAFFFADLFPREGKYGHAAAFPIVYGRSLDDGTYRKPVAAIVANFTKPTDDRPSLLRHGEALTLFHEFGHILHFCLTTVPLVRFSGFDTEWDFVEAPSQIMEHWMWTGSVLQRFARHHETGEPIPDDLVTRMVAARDLNIALHTLRQVFLGQVDLMLHDEATNRDLDEITRTAYRFTQLPYPEETFYLASFGHLMGGYDAGYYGYLWAEVYGDDMFSVFQDEGVLSPDVGARYRKEVLEQGGSRDAVEHLHAFLGRPPSTRAFLRNLGLESGDDAAP